MATVRTVFADQNEIRSYIHASEAAYEAQLDQTVTALLEVPQLQLFTVTGPTCSGKTTTSAKLMKRMREAGKALHLVSFDDFYLNRRDLPRLPDGRIDYDTAATLDLPLLLSAMEHLIREEPTELPVYDFLAGERSGFTHYEPEENDIVIFEGIQAMYPEIRACLPHDVTRSVAIMPTSDAEIGDIRFTAEEIRLLRRLVRDERERSSDAAKTFSMWETVRHNENRSILPYMHTADCTIQSFLPYELSVIRPYAEAVLSALPADDPHAAWRDSLLKRLAVLPVIDADLVPDDSVFREFIGRRKETSV